MSYGLHILVGVSAVVVGYVFFQAEDGIRDLVRSRGLGDVYKRQRFDNAGKLARVKAPVFLMHGNADTLVKPENLARLRRARGDATSELVAGAGHELAYSGAAQAILVGWVNTLSR